MSQEKKHNAYDLRAILEGIELELIRNLRRNLKHHEKEEEKEEFRWEMWQKAKLRSLAKFRKQNREAVEQHSKQIENLINKALQESFDAAEGRMSKLFNKLKFILSRQGIQFPKNRGSKGLDTRPRPDDDFFGVNEKKIDALQETTTPQETATKTVPPAQPKVHTEKTTHPDEAFVPKGKEKILHGKNNDQKLDDLKKQVSQDMKEAQGAIWRRMDDIYRQTVYKAEMFMASGTKTLDQAVDMATKEFLEAGIDCIQYRNGRRANIASYAEMALRTASQRATLLAEGKKRDEWGIHTVFVSAHANACPKCAPWQGKVLVDDVFSSGTAAEAAELGVPLLSTAIAVGLLHPNCRHTLVTYIPGITVLPTVPDEDEAVKTYKAEQGQRALEQKMRKAKREAAGTCDEGNTKDAQLRLRELQKRMREYLDQHPELRREYDREKTRGLTEQKVIGNEAGVSPKPISKLTLEEEGAIVRYVSPDSYVLNDKLRRNADEELTDVEKEWMKKIDSALVKLPNYEGDLNRSLTFEYDDDAKAYFGSFVEGKGYISPQYLSTTKQEMYNDSGEVQIYIQNAKSGKDLGELGIEEEVLYPIGSEFKVIYKTQRDGKYWVLLEEV